jgi:hypothetical protein
MHFTQAAARDTLSPSVPVMSELEAQMRSQVKTHIKHRYTDIDAKGGSSCKFVCHTFWASQFEAVRRAHFGNVSDDNAIKTLYYTLLCYSTAAAAVTMCLHSHAAAHDVVHSVQHRLRFSLLLYKVVVLIVSLLMLMRTTPCMLMLQTGDTAAAVDDSTTDVEEGFIRSLCSASKWVRT